ncbi:DNA-binding response regulator [Saccharomonospora piscinae]|uniref:DNA-binding response regulator n=1 Tax=Saccharomonospora piscinae TaxID=687388 RepID=A0A1V8ZX17_SACPI|nr:response regulator transcription factor [Saccharomonospora piscinae]OQO89412.1 DNA-binding response regulator [Saccharomonospora piscinae]TLW91104.1 response regulator transcription factor [Saccharomonospora piscinae]
MIELIRIVLADDEDLIRGALATLLDLEDDIEVVGQAGDGAKAVALVRGTRPDLAVFDLEMPGTDGLEAASLVHTEFAVPVVIVTRHARPGVLKRALAAGVRGFVPKTTAASRLAEILRDVHSGRRYVDPEIAASALTATACPLTERELELLRHAHTGATVGAIADRVHLAPGTVRNYLSSAMTKLGVSTRYEAARRAWEEGWI